MMGPTQSQDDAWRWAEDNPELFSIALFVGTAEARLVRAVPYAQAPDREALIRSAGYVVYCACLANAEAAWLLTLEREQAALFVPVLRLEWRPGNVRRY
jgi:hypothetical protein